MHIGKDHARLFLLMSSPPGQPGGSHHPLDFSCVALRDFPISAITRGKHCRGCLLFFLSFFLACLFFPSEVTCPLPWIGLLFHIPLVFGVHLQIEWSAFFPGGSFLRVCKGKTAQQDRRGPGGEKWPGLSPHPWVPAPGCLLLASVALEGGCFLFSSLASTWAKTPLFLVPLILSKKV